MERVGRREREEKERMVGRVQKGKESRMRGWWGELGKVRRGGGENVGESLEREGEEEEETRVEGVGRGKEKKKRR